MKKKNLLHLLIVFLLLYACSKDENSTPNPINTNVTYSDISGIISNRCLECHNDPPTNDAIISLNTYQLVRDAAENNDLVARLKSFNSQMPPPPEPSLSPSQIELIEGWKLGGYKQ